MTMTQQPTATVDEHVLTVPPDARHRHDSACYWEVEGFRWQCVTYPLVGYALEHCTAIGRPVADSAPETKP